MDYANIHEQLDWHWREQARPRLDGLSDAEYFWEPVPDCWSVRPVGVSPQGTAKGSGPWQIDFAMPQPYPEPVTTIAWRLGHLIVGVFGARAASHFGAKPADYDTWPYASGAEEALAQLDQSFSAWSGGVQALDTEGWQRPIGPAEGLWAAAPMVDLVLHINREAIHHLAEIALLRDLYLRADQPAAG